MRIRLFTYNARYLVVLIFALLSIFVFAQEPEKMHSTMFGAGTNNVLDSYLSPYNYNGLDIRIMHENMRRTKQMEGHLFHQSLLDINGSFLSNKSKSAKEYTIGARFSYAWLYNFRQKSNPSNPSNPSNLPTSPFGGWGASPPLSGWSAFIGLQPSIYIGGIYNTRNGNNPAQAKVDLMLNATARATYGLRLKDKVLPISYQLTVPLLGIAYSPNYGQSYYEEFLLNHYDHNVCFAHIANMPSMRHLLTLDIPIRKNFLRIGWSGEFNQAKLNGIKYHSYANNFLIGYCVFK